MYQAIKDANASYDALVELLESMERLLSRLDIKLPNATPIRAAHRAILDGLDGPVVQHRPRAVKGLTGQPDGR